MELKHSLNWPCNPPVDLAGPEAFQEVTFFSTTRRSYQHRICRKNSFQKRQNPQKCLINRTFGIDTNHQMEPSSHPHTILQYFIFRTSHRQIRQGDRRPVQSKRELVILIVKEKLKSKPINQDISRRQTVMQLNEPSGILAVIQLTELSWRLKPSECLSDLCLSRLPQIHGYTLSSNIRITTACSRYALKGNRPASLALTGSTAKQSAPSGDGLLNATSILIWFSQ